MVRKRAANLEEVNFQTRCTDSIAGCVIRVSTTQRSAISKKDTRKTGKLQIERREQESVSPFSDIKQAISDKFQKKNDSPTPTGKIDKAWIYIQMYEELPVRDDLGTLKIMFEDVPEQLTNRVDKNFKDPLVKKELLKINTVPPISQSILIYIYMYVRVRT